MLFSTMCSSYFDIWLGWVGEEVELNCIPCMPPATIEKNISQPVLGWWVCSGRIKLYTMHAPCNNRKYISCHHYHPWGGKASFVEALLLCVSVCLFVYTIIITVRLITIIVYLSYRIDTCLCPTGKWTICWDSPFFCFSWSLFSPFFRKKVVPFWSL